MASLVSFAVTGAAKSSAILESMSMPEGPSSEAPAIGLGQIELENNQHLSKREVITDAIRITWECSQKFKPELGFDFATYLRHWLPNRLYDLYGIEKSKRDKEPDVLKTEPIRF